MKKTIITMSVLAAGIILNSFARAEVQRSTPPKSAKLWVAVEEDVWKALREAPAYHFEQAKSAWERKDYKKAAAEIDQGTRFFQLQEKRLAASKAELLQLENDLKGGRIITAKEIDAEFNYAMKALDLGVGFVPSGAGSRDLFAYAPNYHLEKAKELLDKKENTGAAAELHQAVAYMKWQAQFAEEQARVVLNESMKELSNLAQKLGANVSTTETEISQTFSRAKAAIESKQ